MLNHTGRGYSSQNGGQASIANFSDMSNPAPLPSHTQLKALESNINISRILFFFFNLLIFGCVVSLLLRAGFL